jgi:hypothetical protein
MSESLFFCEDTDIYQFVWHTKWGLFVSHTWAGGRQTIAAVVADGVVPPFAKTCAACVLYWTELSKCGSKSERQL